MPRSAVLVVIAALVSFAGLSSHGGEKAAPPVRATGALVVRLGTFQENGVSKVTAFRIADSERLRSLEAFFPNYSSRPSSSIAALWEAGYEVYFTLADRETIRVTVSENGRGKFWSVGRGDLNTQGDFVQFFDELER